MRIKSIEFSGYKSFPGDNEGSGSQTLKLAPLVLIFGKNNSGKSSTARLPRFLLGGMECSDGKVLPLEVRGLRYGAKFLDVVHGGAFYQKPFFRVQAENEDGFIDFSVKLYSEGVFSAEDAPLVWSYMMTAPKEVNIFSPETKVGFSGLLPPGNEWGDIRRAAGLVLDEMVHIGPIRKSINPSYSNLSFERIDFEGANVPQMLRADYRLADAVGRWYAEHMEGWRLSLQRDSESFSVRLTRGGINSNLAYGGEGLQQVLPVVAHQLWRQAGIPRYFLDVVEQPELHLHAAAQAPLADLFINTANLGSGCTIVETNSEPLLLRVQRRVAEGLIGPEKVSIYYIQANESGSELIPIELSADGEVAWWPAGVFEEDFSEVAAIRRAQRDKKSRSDSAIRNSSGSIERK
ncbi:AAA family ATPase [Pseudomonas wadenswilerensis]